MPRLSNKRILQGRQIRETGPFVEFGSGFLLDARWRPFPRIVGSRPQALFGVAHHPSAWGAAWECKAGVDEFARVKEAHERLAQRIESRLAGQVQIHSGDSRVELLREYIGLSLLEQLVEKHQLAADQVAAGFLRLAHNFEDHFAETRISPTDLEFRFALQPEAHPEKLQTALTGAGIMVEPPCDSVFQFQLTLDYSESEMDLFWSRLRLALEHFREPDFKFDSPEVTSVSERDDTASVHLALLQSKLSGQVPNALAPRQFLQKHLNQRFEGLRVEVLNKASYAKCRERILELQQTVYEPARRSPPEEFDRLFESENPLAILVLRGERIVAMVFAGQLSLFTQERGVSTDPYLDDPNVHYSMDLTVVPEFRGGVGRLMKQALCFLAIKNGVTAIHGRNRDRLAAGMWAINLSLGAYELQRLEDDYPDSQPYRDCIYYRCPLKWPALSKQTDVDFENITPLDLIRLARG